MHGEAASGKLTGEGNRRKGKGERTGREEKRV